jgi:hypothetical protein
MQKLKEDMKSRYSLAKSEAEKASKALFGTKAKIEGATKKI